MASREILKNFNLFVDARGYAGVVEEYNPPVLGIKTEDFRAGGMDGTVALDMGLEKLETSFTLSNFDPLVLNLFGFLPGLPTAVTVRGAIEDELGLIKPVIHAMAGRIRTIEQGSWKPGERASMKVTMDLTRYAQTVAGIGVIVIDIPNMIRTIGGVDKSIATRLALGV